MAMILFRPLVALLCSFVVASWEEPVDAQSPPRQAGRTRIIRQHVSNEKSLDSIVVDHAARYYTGAGRRSRELATKSGDFSDAVSSEAHHGVSTHLGFMPRHRQVILGEDDDLESRVGRGPAMDSDNGEYSLQEDTDNFGQHSEQFSVFDTPQRRALPVSTLGRHAAQDCYFEAWSSWGACTKTCVEGGTYGYKTRDRGRVGPFNGGKACHGHTSDDSLCNTFPCPSECQAGPWGMWSACTQTCSSSLKTHGYMIRSRTSIPETNGGKACGANWQMQHCNTHLCAFDCYFEEWKNGPCSKSCTPTGGAAGTRLKTRGKIGPRVGGKDCAGPLEMTETCNNVACAIDCTFTQWGQWSACDKTCGSGGRTRHREKKGGDPNGKDCVGPTTMMEACNAFGCPVDCKWTPWNGWQPCSKTCGLDGVSSRGRAFDPSPSNGGAECPGTFVEMIECNVKPCPVDCKYESWLQWSLCSTTCGSGKRFRTRLKQFGAFYGGKQCYASPKEDQPCQLGECPVDCRHDEWQEWSTCSKTCGKGTRSALRELLHAKHGGSSDCPKGDLNKTEECNVKACAPPPDAKASARLSNGQTVGTVMLAMALLCISQ
jgi:hypothetical protein